MFEGNHLTTSDLIHTQIPATSRPRCRKRRIEQVGLQSVALLRTEYLPEGYNRLVGTSEQRGVGAKH